MEEASFLRNRDSATSRKLRVGETMFQSGLDTPAKPLSEETTISEWRTADTVRREGKPAAPGRPGDLRECDLAKMDAKLMGALYDDDAWVDPVAETQKCHRGPDATLLIDTQQQVDKRRAEKAPTEAQQAIRQYLKNALYKNEVPKHRDEVSNRVLETLIGDGTTQQSLGAKLALRGWETKNAAGAQEGKGITVRRGTDFETGEYKSDVVGIGHFAIDRIDFGEVLRPNAGLEIKLNAGEDDESKKCTVLALAAAVEWVAQGQPKRCPSRQRIDVLASVIRMGEIVGDEQAIKRTADVNARVAWRI